MSVERDRSQVLPEIAKELKVLSLLVPIAIITSKDFAFVHPRTSFASGWECCSGLEISLDAGNAFLTAPTKGLGDLLDEVKKILPNGPIIEKRCLDMTL